MIKEFIESLKLKDLVFFVLIIVLFFMYFKKNKKEGFTYTSPTDAIQKGTFKADVEEALGDNLTAIKNLGDFAGQLLTSQNVLDLSAVDLKVKSLDVKGDPVILFDGKYRINYIPNFLASACFKNNGKGAQDFSGNCGSKWDKISGSNNKGITWAWTKTQKKHGTACVGGSAGSVCQNVIST